MSTEYTNPDSNNDEKKNTLPLGEEKSSDMKTDEGKPAQSAPAPQRKPEDGSKECIEYHFRKPGQIYTDFIKNPSPMRDNSFSNLENSYDSSPFPRVKIKELVGILLSVIFCDRLLYAESGGYTGFAIVFALFPLLMYYFKALKTSFTKIVVIYPLILLLSIKLFIHGSNYKILSGIILITYSSVILSGIKTDFVETLFSMPRIFFGGFRSLGIYLKSTKAFEKKAPKISGSFLIPFVLIFVFSVIFIKANPVLQKYTYDILNDFFKNITDFIPEFSQIIFWLLIIFLSAALFRPWFSEMCFKSLDPKFRYAGIQEAKTPEDFFPISRNILLSLIVLFAAYLIFEFYYLWYRPIPAGFQYSEYAHEGAGWLTFGLLVATIVIGVIFKSANFGHEKIGSLKKIAWIWAAENFILIICTFHRTDIYILYNGLSYMRIVAMFGIGTVAAGLVLVVLKMEWNKDFAWLFKKHLTALALGIFLFQITPVDYFVTLYNVNQILKGNPAPSVQISAHAIDSDGICNLFPLLNSDNKDIREGVKAKIAEFEMNTMKKYEENEISYWTHYQYLNSKLSKVLKEKNAEWAEYKDAAKRDNQLNLFRNYTQQWYDSKAVSTAETFTTGSPRSRF